MNEGSWLSKVISKYGAPKSRKRLVTTCVGIFFLSGALAYGAQLGFRQYTENAVIVSSIFGFLAILGSFYKGKSLWMVASVFLGILFGSILLAM